MKLLKIEISLLFSFLFLFFTFLYNALTISWYGIHNRAWLQIKCALGGGDSPQHWHWVLLSPPIECRETRLMLLVFAKEVDSTFRTF